MIRFRSKAAVREAGQLLFFTTFKLRNIMTKLTIAHLAPYLPLGLKPLRFVIPNGAERTLEGLDKAWNVFGRTGMLVDKHHVETIKPILRPLSDLCRGSAGNHVTQHKINLILGGGTYGPVLFSHYCDYLTVHHSPKNDSNPFYGRHISMQTVKRIERILLTDHFDIFGLIKKGLAIDINTL